MSDKPTNTPGDAYSAKLRDQFAAAALPAVLDGPYFRELADSHVYSEFVDEAAEKAYLMADAMLRARGGRPADIIGDGAIGAEAASLMLEALQNLADWVAGKHGPDSEYVPCMADARNAIAIARGGPSLYDSYFKPQAPLSSAKP